MRTDARELALWNGERGTGGVSWEERSRLGPLRGVMDVADEHGGRNLYMHVLQTKVLRTELRRIDRRIRALDFGCGTGRFLNVLGRYFSAVYAVDREPTMVDAARVHAEGFARNICAWTSDRLPFDEDFFDFILCSSVLSVTTRELFDRSLIELGRVSRAGGALLLLEKASVKKGLSLNSYGTALKNAGFELVRAYPIRTATSRLTAMVTRLKWLPAVSYGVFARLELCVMRNRTFPSPDPYVEYALVARRL